MTQKLPQIGALALLTLGAITAIYLSNIHTAYLDRIADCVINEAITNDYAGNPYSADAWALFAPSCK